MRIREIRTYRAEIFTPQHKIILGEEPSTYEGDAGKCIVVYGPDNEVLFDVHGDGTSTIGGGANTHSFNGTTVKSILEIHSEGGSAPAGLTIHNHGTSDAAGSELTFFRSKGTHASPAAVSNGSVIGRMSAFPYDGDDHTYGALIGFYVDGSVSTDDVPVAIVFSTADATETTPSERIRIKPDGEIQFKNGGGLAYGGMYGADVASTLTITTAGKGNKVQVTAFAVNGPSSASVTPDHTNDHQTVTVAGDYEIDVALAVDSDTGTAFSGGFSVYKNNGATEIPTAHAHHDFASGGGEEATIILSGIATLAVNDTIEVWGWNEDNTTNMVISSISMKLKQIGAS